jgi:hypothetical protein
MHRAKTPGGLLRLVVALAIVGGLSVLLHLLSPRLPGTAGDLYRRNVAEDVPATALVYTESGDVRDYLDDETGRYRAPLQLP